MKVSALNPNFGGKVPHLLLEKGQISDVVLLPGDPGRVEMFKELLEDFKVISSNREYKVATGTYNGFPITICSTGIGAPSAEIAIIQLIELGAKALIRIGGTGVLKEEIRTGEMVLTTGAMRLGGSTHFYAPLEYPAVASFEVMQSLIEACENEGVNYWKGISASVGSFYAGEGRMAAGKKFYDDDLLAKYRNMNIINMEMESETVLTFGSLYDIHAGCICAVHANVVTDEWLFDFAPAQKQMCKIALDAAVLMYQNHLK